MEQPVWLENSVSTATALSLRSDNSGGAKLRQRHCGLAAKVQIPVIA